MRTIKFRAWYKDNSKMLDWAECLELFELGDLEEPTNIEKNCYTFMQFTGLEDLKGVQIYEGDIVRTGEYLGEVQYDEQQSAFIILFHPHNKKQKSGCANLASTFPSPSKEIIGNIYQNPELLK